VSAGGDFGEAGNVGPKECALGSGSALGFVAGRLNERSVGRKDESVSFDFSPLGAGSLGKQPQAIRDSTNERQLRANGTAGDATTLAEVLVARSLVDSPLGRATMYPVLFHFSLPSVVPRLFLVITLALALTALGLSFLIRERRTLVSSLITACVATALLLALRLHGLSRVHVAVTPFGAALVLSILLGWRLSLREASKVCMDRERVDRILGWALLGGLVGARLGYVAFCLPHASSWREILSFESGGLFGYGAYFGALTGAAMASRRQPRNLGRWLDVETPVLLSAIGLTRLGCYLEGCDFGRPLNVNAPRLLRALGTYPRWSMATDGSFDGPPAWLHHVSDFGLSTESAMSLATHPTQLYEVLFVIVLAALALQTGKNKDFHGRTFLLMALCYSAARYFLEMLRGDPDRGIIGAERTGHWLILRSWTQVFAAMSVVVALFLWRKWRDTALRASSKMGDK